MDITSTLYLISSSTDRISSDVSILVIFGIILVALNVIDFIRRILQPLAR